MSIPERATSSSATQSGTGYDELPLFFSTGGQRLYGVFHPPQSSLCKNRVVVFCHSLGIEHMMTQRMEALGARAAAKTGFAAFRYDSRAHGDSAGDAKEVTFTDLVDDACAASDYALKLSGASRVIWVGVRFGSLISAAAIARRNDAAGLALWEPLHQGSDYFRAAIRTMLFCQVAQGRRSVATANDLLNRLKAGAALPVVGTYLYSALWHGAHDAELCRSLLKWGGCTLIAQVQHRPALSASNQRLRSEIEQRGGKVSVVLIDQEPSWSMLPVVRPQWTSDILLAATQEWLDGME